MSTAPQHLGHPPRRAGLLVPALSTLGVLLALVGVWLPLAHYDAPHPIVGASLAESFSTGRAMPLLVIGAVLLVLAGLCWVAGHSIWWGLATAVVAVLLIWGIDVRLEKSWVEVLAQTSDGRPAGGMYEAQPDWGAVLIGLGCLLNVVAALIAVVRGLCRLRAKGRVR